MNTVIVDQPMPSYDPILVRSANGQSSESSGLFSTPGSSNTCVKQMRVPIWEVSSSSDIMASPNNTNDKSNSSSAFGSSASLYSSYMSACPSSAAMGTLDEEDSPISMTAAASSSSTNNRSEMMNTRSESVRKNEEELNSALDLFAQSRVLKAGFRRLADIADTNSDSEDSAESGIVLKKDFSDENISSSNNYSHIPSGFVNLDDFEITKVLGKGAYGKVYQVRKRGGLLMDRTFAMKAVNKARIRDSKTDTRHTKTERDVLAKVNHPFLVKMYYAFETRKRVYFVTEFCRGGELFRLMEMERMILEESARFYLAEICLALEYLHSLNIVYRDLKTENIMLDREGHIKLIDFGLSKIFETDDESEQLTQTFCGTVEYMAPEVVIKLPGHGKPADWWSYGIFMYDILTGRSPFHSSRGKKETKERILRGKFAIPKFISDDAADLLRRLIRRNVDRRLGSRLGASEIKAHMFFRGTDWDRVEARDYRPPYVPSCDPDDECDVSQFDPKFTDRSPRESQTLIDDLRDCRRRSSGDNFDVEAERSKLFENFDYVAPDILEAERKRNIFKIPNSTGDSESSDYHDVIEDCCDVAAEEKVADNMANTRSPSSSAATSSPIKGEVCLVRRLNNAL